MWINGLDFWSNSIKNRHLRPSHLERTRSRKWKKQSDSEILKSFSQDQHLVCHYYHHHY